MNNNTKIEIDLHPKFVEELQRYLVIWGFTLREYVQHVIKAAFEADKIENSYLEV